MSKQTIEDILEMFQNGEARYNKDAYFKEAINALHVGVGPHAILDRVLKEHAILMHLHNEALNKNRVAVGECQRLVEQVADYDKANEFLKESFNEVGLLAKNQKRAIQILNDEVASYKDALELSRQSRKL